MPEGPEVTWMVDQLSPFVGGRLQSVRVISGKYKRKAPPRLSEARGDITAIANWGKMVWIELDGGAKYVKITPAMTGFLIPFEGKYPRLAFRTDRGIIYFDDQRNFGTIAVLGAPEFAAARGRLGMFPLAGGEVRGGCQRKEVDATADALLARGRPIADLLLDQKYIAGVGNYLRSEILGEAGVLPWKVVTNRTEMRRIVQTACRVMRSSYRYQVKHGFRSYKKKFYEADGATAWKGANGRRVWYKERAGR
jgi:formamidopyrimidine-DNA glycosylase